MAQWIAGVKRTALILVCLCGMQAMAQTRDLADMHSRVAELQHLISQQRYDDAIQLAHSLLRNAARYPAGQKEVLEDRIELALALKRSGRSGEAEAEYRAIIQASSSRIPSSTLSRAYYDLSGILFLDGRTVDATHFAYVALRIDRALHTSPNLLAGDLLQVATCAGHDGRDVIDRIDWLLEARQLLGTKRDETSRSQRVMVLHLLVTLYSEIGDDPKVASTYQEWQPLLATQDELAQFRRAQAVSRRDLLIEEGHFAEAEQLYEQLRPQLSPSRGLFARASDALSDADVYFRLHDYSKSLAAFHDGMAQVRALFRNQLGSMTSAEKYQIALYLKSQLAEFLSFCKVYQKEHRELIPEAYEMLLWQKAFFSKALRAGGNANAAAVDREHPAFTTIAALKAALPQQDAAVEIVRFLERDQAGALNRIDYVALIMQPREDHKVVMADLGEEDALRREQTAMHGVMLSRDPQPQRPGYTSTAWEHMERGLQGARRIYLATDGLFDAVPFYAWRHSDGRYLLDHDEIDLRPVFSTGELTVEQPHGPSPNTALLIGNPDFGGAIAAQEMPYPSLADNTRPELPELRSSTGGHVDDLPYTHTELADIYKELLSQHYRVQAPLERKAATTSALLSAERPTVLHVATHGFFVPSADVDERSTEGLQQSLTRSGLLLAGANTTLGDESKADEKQPGVVTAFSITGMNLQGTDLVVLSSCDSGLGQTGESGQLFGLRTSFHNAGARHLLTSLWEVNDRASAEMMAVFYRNWLQGEDEYDALRASARELRTKHPEPYYWAPFVMYGP